jgi:hypothetical protein
LWRSTITRNWIRTGVVFFLRGTGDPWTPFPPPRTEIFFAFFVQELFPGFRRLRSSFEPGAELQSLQRGRATKNAFG